jgi:hypothetical protein
VQTNLVAPQGKNDPPCKERTASALEEFFESAAADLEYLPGTEDVPIQTSPVAPQGKNNTPRRERIALAVEEFYESMATEMQYLAEWWEIGVDELTTAAIDPITEASALLPICQCAKDAPTAQFGIPHRGLGPFGNSLCYQAPEGRAVPSLTSLVSSS